MIRLLIAGVAACGCTFAQVQRSAVANEALRLMNTGKADAAVELLRTEIAKDPGNQELRRYLGTAYGEARRFDEAIAAVQDVLREDPVRFESLALLGRLYFDKGDLAQAQAVIRRGVEASRTNQQLQMNYMSVAIVFGRTRLDFSVMIDEELNRVYPDNVPIANNLAYGLANQNKDLDRALRLAQFAFESQPNATPIIGTLGWVYFKLKRYQEALPLLCRSLLAQADDQERQDHVRKTLEALGKLTPPQSDLLDWLRSDDDPERIGRIRELAATLAQ